MSLARDILVIPILTVASESAFSTSGRLVSSHRSRLHPKTIETLMSAQSWLSNEKQATSSQETKAYYSSVEYDEDTIDVDGVNPKAVDSLGDPEEVLAIQTEPREQ
ncbi:hypothetical protein ZIOFF_011582 [Zingiber officinale]|uniref:HAT C-terminal dimerisation domain-containing protein n=1 Tax=Zingiber officinale TaxID=94328 RepID=A0A8J5M1D9_ZINOF|nr:hypothetical protein ZIOFF_011582 [Zingiber officinale]